MDSYNKYSKQYPHFIFHHYEYEIKDKILNGEFIYHINNENDTKEFELRTQFAIEYVNNTEEVDEDIDTMVFQLGMVEAISYWKTTCPPKFSISCGKIDHWQKTWWRKLYKKGLAEFFYLNDIHNWDEKNLEFVESYQAKLAPKSRTYSETKIMVPIGGGKDSIATLELLKDRKEDIIPVVMNPIKASEELIAYNKFTKYIKITRKLDRQIVKMNEAGFLNGHIPFSAVLSFYTMVASRMYGIKHIALSNESSANEPTIIGTYINHQYSKSLEFELDIKEYATRYMDPDINYFSLLRPFNEYQITKIFSNVDREVLKIFLSCNVGSKKGVWCTKCPKCLFTYIMIHAHLPLETMIDIYGGDLLNDEELKGYFLSLTGQRTEKPFECVGTIEEVNAALNVINFKRRDDLPALFKYWNTSLVEREADQLLIESNVCNLNQDFSILISKAFPNVIL